MNKLFCFILLFVLIGCHKPKQKETLPFFNTPEFEPEWIDKSSNQYSQIHRIKDFSFLDQNGNAVSQNTFKNKLYVANFFFTICPGICPLMTENMHQLQEQFINNNNVLLLSHTVTPWIDSVAQLKKYAIEKNVNDEKWFLVTGEQNDIYSIARKSYFADKEIGLQKSDDEFLHTENFLLIDRNQRIRGIYNGTKQSDIDRLFYDIDILLKEI